MILKTKSVQNAQSPQAIAGQQQEQNVAFFLRRAFKDHPQVLVINDFKFRFNDETAQIDHLIIYTYGFVLVESKSIKGQVLVNQQEEWTRSHQNKWFGMPSPIKQVAKKLKPATINQRHNQPILNISMKTRLSSLRAAYIPDNPSKTDVKGLKQTHIAHFQPSGINSACSTKGGRCL